jgi:hypothetical protein
MAMIPMIYLISGLWNLCTAKAPFQQRIPAFSYQRMQHSCVGVLLLIGVTGVSDVVYLIRNHISDGKTLLDLGYLVGILLCLAGIYVQYRLLRPVQAICLTEESETTAEAEEAAEDGDATAGEESCLEQEGI